MRKILCSILLALALLVAGCVRFTDDKVWISDEKYKQARAGYDLCGSLDLTRTALEDDPTWTHAEINEAVYRLQKQLRLE